MGPLALDLLSCDFDCTILDTVDEYSLDEVVGFGLFGPVSFSLLTEGKLVDAMLLVFVTSFCMSATVCSKFHTRQEGQ